jgi:PKD repeat protein
MKRLFCIFGVLLIWFFSFDALADSTIDPCKYSTAGTDFWFGFMQNRLSGDTHYIEITVTSQLGAQFTLAYGSNETSIGTYSVGANSSVAVRLDYSLLEPSGSETIENKGLHLLSTNPVCVYAFNYRTRSSDVAVIYPTASLGKEYFAMCYTPHVQTGRETNSEFLIVATIDNTTVNIIPTVDTDSGNKAGTTFKVTLKKGQSYQVQSSTLDLTGSYVSTDKPVAFFSGTISTSVPVTGDSYDHLYEQLSPTSTWGREFYVVPLQMRTKDTYRVLASEDGTVVTIQATNTKKTLKRGEFYEFELSGSQASRIISTKKVLIALYCRSQKIDDSSGVGDPFMIMISPVSQKTDDVYFVAYESSLIQNIFYINVVIRTSDIGNITLDGSGISSFFSPFSNTEYSYARIPIAKGVHRLRTTSSGVGFLAFIYGFGDNNNTESYGYGVGFNLNLQLDLGGTNETKDTIWICKGNKEKLDAGAYFDKYKWSTGDTLSSIDVSTEGWYQVAASTTMGCNLSAKVYLKVVDPKINFGSKLSSCGPGKIILDAGKGFETYKWQDGSTGQKFVVNKTGDYWVVGTTVLGCQTGDTVHVDVYPVPKVKIVGDSLNCGVFTSSLKVDIANVDTLLWNYAGAGKWTSSSTDLVFENTKPDGVTLKAKKTGIYTVNYVLTTKNGCSDSDSFKVGFFDTPESSFTVESPESTDKCSSYERIVKYTGKSGSTAKYTWDFGGLMVLETIAPNQYKVSIGANKPNRTISLLVEEHGCSSPLTTQNIGVKPTFNFGADKVQGCDAMCVQFSSEVTIMDKVAYEWTFGDGGVSDLANPLHCYKDTGKYDVSLMVTNVIDGCRNGSVEPEMIKIYPTPKAVISADPATCYGDTVIFKYLNAKENSHGKWFAKGNQLLSDENTKATYFLKNEISEIGFVVEENKCSCDTLKVQVKRKPNFDFAVDETEVCLPVPVTLKAVPKDPNLQFSWSVDSLQIPGDSLTHLFSGSGFYNVSLEGFSSLTGCSDVVTKDRFIHVYPLPVPGYSQNYKVATLDHPEITFSNETTGAHSYFWDFGDGTTSEEINPKHKYTEIGEYDVVMQAVTDFGCTDTIGSRVKIVPYSFYMANAFRPDSDIPENRVFVPIPKGVDPANYKFDVFNRVGSTVFESTNPEAGWDGNLSNGSKAASGIYVWIIKYTDIQGFDHLQKGSVMLVR